ncbi:hemolysin XhlA family protein [Paenibacillus flagellatus]|uniref:Peptidase n=1 Tax=Paenibacillus flagellatus TaxID=2211139 RepID=A0A2V5KNC7_9BACL|nr:hemolysin XhlA family protein [Paenibacillus flagellatus]PYI52557.1 peptidase [Paenibacillus flagellatus]
MGDSDIQKEILQRLTRVETKLDMMSSVRDMAQEALQSTAAAHKRLDRLEKIVYWAATTIIGSVIVGVMAMLFNLKEG